MPSPLVTTTWLAENLSRPDLVIIDVRWYLLTPERRGIEEYQRGHIPRAVFLDVDRDLASPPLEGPGRHPLPSPHAFQSAARRAGIRSDSYVVAYDDTGGATAARMWWL